LGRSILAQKVDPEVFAEMLKPLTIIPMVEAESSHEYNLVVDSPIDQEKRKHCS
jgi:hypothetical protein